MRHSDSNPNDRERQAKAVVPSAEVRRRRDNLRRLAWQYSRQRPRVRTLALALAELDRRAQMEVDDA